MTSTARSPFVSNIINQSRYIVIVPRKPEFTGEFPHTKAAEAEAYKAKLLAEKGLKAEIERGPLKLLVRIRTPGWPEESQRVHSYDEAREYETQILADQIRCVRVDPKAARKTLTATLIQRYIDEECVNHKGKDIEIATLTGMLEDSRGILARQIEEFKAAKKRGENPKPLKSRRKPRTNLKWLQRPFAEARSEHLMAFKTARLLQVAPATVDRELDLLSGVIHMAINSWDYVVAKNPMIGVKRPTYDNQRDRRFEGDEQERLFRSARREDLIRSREIALESLLLEAREHAKGYNASWRQRFLKKERIKALKRLRRGYEIVPLFESLIAFLLETAARRSEALALKRCYLDLQDETAFFPDTKNSMSRTVPVQRFTMDLIKLLPQSEERIFPLTDGEFEGAWKRIAERAGLRERDRSNKRKCSIDFHLHDLRHEGLSRICEIEHARNPRFNVYALKAISGHLDTASLDRYITPKPKIIGRQLNESFAEAGISPDGGYRRSRSSAQPRGVALRPVSNVIPFPSPRRLHRAAPVSQSSASARGLARAASPSTDQSPKPSKV
jgi:integrase